MQKLFRIKQNIVTCLIAGMFVGGMGISTCAAEVVDAQIAESDTLNGLHTVMSRNVSCTVEKNGTVTYMAELNRGMPVSDDGMLYLFELAPYEYDITGDTKLIGSAALNTAVTTQKFTFPVNFRQADTRLYSKFAIGVKSGGVVYMVSEPTYITNPEALAWNTLMRYPRTKKSTQGEEFNNVFMDGTYGPELGWVFKTLQVLNTGDCKELTHPMSRADARRADSKRISKPMYYMFNASDAEGVNALVSHMEYCVANSLGGENWIIGNEVNTRTWNYMAWTDWDTYIKEYTQAFRVMYNAIMSTNANARVYVCLDQIWDRNLTPADKDYYQYMDGKDFLEKFNALIKQSGDINWGVAQHPYTNPMGYAKFWDMSGCKKGDAYAAQVAAGQVVTFQNLSVLTDFMQTPAMLDTDGNVRHIILSEIGLSNAQGSEIQAAAMCASYAAVMDNPFIDEMMYLLVYSSPGMDTRLDTFSQRVYDEMDGINSNLYLDWAKSYIGINDWSEIIW
ncbi:MAG: hypothetical protein K2M91_10010 [Lachnospiraceae bacterium]|nr:hypothetical protein [Lachnospiraceae bacterium]